MSDIDGHDCNDCNDCHDGNDGHDGLDGLKVSNSVVLVTSSLGCKFVKGVSLLMGEEELSSRLPQCGHLDM